MPAETDYYYRYYDLLHEKKDYAGEIDTVLRIGRECGCLPLTKVLDVGCGTGNHSFELARRGCQVVGVDIDGRMLAMARAKRTNAADNRVEFIDGGVEALSQREFDLTVALFNVVNYILDVPSLISFFKAIRERIRENGIFIFDSINGVAAMRDPAQRKESQVEGSCGERLRVVLTPTTDFWNESVTLDGRVEVEDAGRTISYGYSLRHRLWTSRVLREILSMTEMEVVNVCRWAQPEATATSDDWKIMFVCRRRQES